MQTHKPADLKAHSLYKPKERSIPLGSAQWKKLRAQVLLNNPLCFYCGQEGKVVPADTVDHFDNNGSNNSLDNLVSCCHSCNSIKSAGRFEPRGCDVNGNPLDPEHEWNNHQKGSDDLPPPEAHTHHRNLGGS